MNRSVLGIVVFGVQLWSQEISPHAWEGTWQGSWSGYGVVNHNEKGSQSTLTLRLTLKASTTGKLSGIAETSPFQHQPAKRQMQALGTAPPRIPPPPGPLPTPPPSGNVLNPRIEGRTLIFQVKGSDAKLVTFRLNFDTRILNVANSTNSRVYPEFQMKRVQ
jgi:hypothetical protein